MCLYTSTCSSHTNSKPLLLDQYFCAYLARPLHTASPFPLRHSYNSLMRIQPYTGTLTNSARLISPYVGNLLGKSAQKSLLSPVCHCIIFIPLSVPDRAWNLDYLQISRRRGHGHMRQCRARTLRWRVQKEGLDK
jgi:hypothetical protein